jgi:hypothetical protein
MIMIMTLASLVVLCVSVRCHSRCYNTRGFLGPVDSQARGFTTQPQLAMTRQQMVGGTEHPAACTGGMAVRSQLSGSLAGPPHCRAAADVAAGQRAADERQVPSRHVVAMGR